MPTGPVASNISRSQGNKTRASPQPRRFQIFLLPSPADRVPTEVLQLIAEGAPTKQIAEQLGISIKRVEKHRVKVMSQLDIHDTAGLTHCAIAADIIENSVQLTIV